jgi:glycosyltransferase involved in cell wall biosynthesis
MKSLCVIVQHVYDVDVRVRRKADALVAAGYSVDVLALRPANGQQTYVLNGVNVHTMSLGKRRGSPARYIFEYVAFFLWTFVKLSILMRRRRYAVVEVNTLPDFLIFAAAPARWRGAKLILDMHEITPEFYISKYRTRETSWFVRLLKWQERLSFNFADHVITINEPIQDLLSERGLSRSKSTVIMNAADESRFAGTHSSPDGTAAPASSKFVMMYHGTLTNIYGLDIAIEAFSRAHHEMPGAELWILGSGPEAGLLNSLAERYELGSKVKLLGEVLPAQIPGLLRQCTVGVLPIRRDVFLDFAFPNKLPELVIMGKTVIVSRLKAIRTYFSEGALAYFEPNSPQDLAKQMVGVYRDPGLRERLAHRAKLEYVGIRWDIMKDRYLTLVDGLIDATNKDQTLSYRRDGRVA